MTRSSRSCGFRALCLPEVRPSSHIYGETAPALFGRPIPIAGVAGDQQAATFGQACHIARRRKEHLRHGLLSSDEYGRDAAFSKQGLLTTIAWQLENRLVRPARKPEENSPNIGTAKRRNTRNLPGWRLYATLWKAVSLSRARRSSGCAMSSDHPRGGRDRTARTVGSGQRRRLLRPGVHRTGHAPLGPLCRAARSWA